MLGVVFILEECNEDFLYLFFRIFLDTLFLYCDNKPCIDYVIYIEVVTTFFHLSLNVLFLFSLYAHDCRALVVRWLFMSFS